VVPLERRGFAESYEPAHAKSQEPPARSAGNGASRELNRRVHLKYVTEGGLELDAVKPYLATDDITLCLRPTTVSSWDLRNTEQGRALLESAAFHRLEPVH
jgi:hypothetical protein